MVTWVVWDILLRGSAPQQYTPYNPRDHVLTNTDFLLNDLYGSVSFQYQWDVKHGECGICGDPAEAGQRVNEPGPDNIYANGIIVRQYTEGQTIEAKVEITAHHKGWFEFRICPHNDVTTPATHSCLDNNLLPLANGLGVTRYSLPEGSGNGWYTVSLQLPMGLTCEQCVFQWKYHAGRYTACRRQALSPNFPKEIVEPKVPKDSHAVCRSCIGTQRVTAEKVTSWRYLGTRTRGSGIGLNGILEIHVMMRHCHTLNRVRWKFPGTLLFIISRLGMYLTLDTCCPQHAQ